MNTEYIIIAIIALGFAVGIYFLTRSDNPIRDKGPSRKNPMDPEAWEIGPINDRNHNHSDGYEDDPVPDPHPEGWQFEISEAKQPHYVTYRHGPLTGKTQIRMRFRVEGPADAILHGAGNSEAHTTGVVLYFECPDEDGTRNFSDEGQRWWATFAPGQSYIYLNKLPQGEIELVAPLDGNWSSVVAATRATYPEMFAKALPLADRVGFTFLNYTGWGHGAAATKPVKFIVTHFSVE